MILIDLPPCQEHNQLISLLKNSPIKIYLGDDDKKNIPYQEEADFVIYLNPKVDIWNVDLKISKKLFLAEDYPSIYSFISTILKGYKVEKSSINISKGYLYYKDNSVFKKIFKKQQKLLYTKDFINSFFPYLPKVIEERDDEIEIERIPYVTRMTEWSNYQIIEAFKFICIFSLELKKRGYCLADPHLGNISYHHNHPIYLDIDSIFPISNYDPEGFFSCLLSWAPFLPPELVNYVKTLKQNFQLNDLNKILKKIETIKIKEKGHKFWSKYSIEKDIPKNLQQYREYGINVPKFQTVLDVLQSLEKTTLIDVGCNKGICSFMASMLGYEVIGIDNVADVITAAHIEGKKRNSKTSFAVIDLINPPEAMGLGAKYGSYEERLKSDTCIAAAITHHLFHAGCNFEKQAEIFNQLTNKNLLVEFIPNPKYYSQESFISAINKHFEIIEIKKSSPDPRIWVLAKKNTNT